MTPSELEVLYEDNHLLAVNKPAGLLTQPSGSERENLEDLAKEWIRIEKNKPGAVYLHTLHRLDKPVSGVVLFARTSKSLTRLNEHMRNRQVRRIYHAVVDPAPNKKEATLIHYLRHRRLHSDVCAAKDEGAKKAVLQYRVLKPLAGGVLLEVELETGRYHQIRAQFGAVGSPVRGDALYGSETKSRSGGIWLHHRSLTVTHPVTKQVIEIVAPYPGFWRM